MDNREKKEKVFLPMSVDEAYEYYWQVYEKGIYSLIQLQIKHRKGEEARSSWESYRKKDRYAARDFESYENMQKALKMVIREINQSRLCFSPVPQSIDDMDLEMEKKKIEIAHRTLLSSYENMQKALKMVIREINQSRLCLSPVPQSTDNMDLEMEKKKIEIAHRTLLSSAKKSILGCGDSYYHNIRAYLINRIEQASNYRLVVNINDDNVVQILDREEYLKHLEDSF